MSLNKSNFNNIYKQFTQLVKTNARNINDTNVTYETVRDLKLTADVVTSVDLNGVGSGGGTVNIEIDNELNFTSENPVENRVITEAISSLSSNKLDLSAYVVDSALNETSINPVENRVITEAISSLSSNKLDLSAYVVDSALNETSINPVENRAIRGLIYDIINRVTQLEFVNNIKLSYATNLEVFATRTPIIAGTTSEKMADVSRMFANTNKWSNLSSYTIGAIVTDYTAGNKNSTQDDLLSQTVGIYKALSDVPAGTALTVDTYW